jgi:hypothetical protein
LLTGRKPFGSGGRTVLVTQQASTTSLPTLPSELGVPDGIETLLRAALSVEPDERPQTAQVFADALLSREEGERASVSPSGPTRLTVWLAAVVVFLMTTVLTWLFR